jgi:superfamily II DNA or RNA helicase
MNEVTIILRDGILEVLGNSRDLKEKLRYFRKEIRLVGYQRQIFKRFEDLYTESEPNHLVTMPGFAHKCLEYFRNAGIEFKFKDARTPMPEPNLAKAFEGLRPYQVNIVGRMLKSGGGIISAATGAGKTCMSSAVIRAYDRKELFSRGTPTCVFACPDRDINRKNWEELKHWLPDREIGLIMSGVPKVPSDDVICCTIDSLEHIDPSTVGILIVDEMHTSASNTRAEKISAFTKAAKWGVSATPTGRFDGADLVSEGLYGPVVATFSYQDGVKAGALVPITVLWLDAPEPTIGLTTYSNFQKRDAKLRHGMISNEPFSQMIADIMNNTKDEFQTLCMLQFIEQMSKIHSKCKNVSYVHAETDESKLAAYSTISAIKPKERKAMYDDFKDGKIRKAIATHVWATGVNFVNLSVVINAGGGGSDIIAKQVPGRASRSIEGKDHAYIVDFIHPWDREDPITRTGKPGPLLVNDYSRRRAYKDLGFEQIKCNSIMELPFIDKETTKCTPTIQRSQRRNLIF